jgi:threonine dehydratase
MTLPVTLTDVEAAAKAIEDAIVCTPTTLSRTLSEITGARVHLKFENLQFTSSFKERGARNFLLDLPPDTRAAGVVAASAGNHAQGVAYHARLLGITATIVMPADTPFSKITQTEHHGARIVVEGADFAAALETAQRIASDERLTLVPAFDDPRIIAGQGTVGLEILDAVPEVDVIVVPVGGGGLIAGVATAAKGRRRDVAVIGAQVEGYDGLRRALAGQTPPAGGTTIAEGIAVTQPGALTTEIARALVDDVLLVSEQTIEEAVALALEIEKTVVEGAGAAGLAAVLAHRERFAGRDVAIVLSGGNIDLRVLASVVLRALARSGRLVRLRIHVADRPGVLATVARSIGDLGGNIVDVAHRRDLPGLALKSAMLDVSIETRDAQHADEIVHALETAGLRVERSTSA